MGMTRRRRTKKQGVDGNSGLGYHVEGRIVYFRTFSCGTYLLKLTEDQFENDE